MYTKSRFFNKLLLSLSDNNISVFLSFYGICIVIEYRSIIIIRNPIVISKIILAQSEHACGPLIDSLINCVIVIIYCLYWELEFALHIFLNPICC